MRSFRFVLILAAVAAVVAPAAAACPPPQPTTAALRIARFDPLTLRGLSFRPGEVVRVAGIANGTKVGATAHATAGGTFMLTLPNVHAGGCSGAIYLRATGSLGSLAILKMPPRLCAVRSP